MTKKGRVGTGFSASSIFFFFSLWEPTKQATKQPSPRRRGGGGGEKEHAKNAGIFFLSPSATSSCFSLPPSLPLFFRDGVGPRPTPSSRQTHFGAISFASQKLSQAAQQTRANQARFTHTKNNNRTLPHLYYILPSLLASFSLSPRSLSLSLSSLFLLSFPFLSWSRLRSDDARVLLKCLSLSLFIYGHSTGACVKS